MRVQIGRTRRVLIVLAAVAGALGAGPGRARETVPTIDLGGVDTRSAALMLSAQEAGDLEVSALVVPLPGPAGASRVTLITDLAGASLLEAAEAAPAAGELIVEVYAYALDAEGGLIDTLTQAFRLDLERHRPLLAAGGVKFFGGLELAPGAYSVRVLVLQRSSGRMALRILPLAVPSWQEDAVVLPPLRREPAGGWILAHAAGVTPVLATVGGKIWAPSARQALDAGGRAHYLLLGRGLDHGVRGQLVDTGREVLSEIGLGDLRPATGGPTGVEALAAELDASALEAGEYRLRISAGPPAGGPAGAPMIADSATLTIRPAAATLPEPAEPAGLSARDSRGREAAAERFEEVREAYSQALGRLAAGDRIGALEPLVEVESSRIGSGSLPEQKRLARTEVEVASELAGPDPERMLAVIRIHEALYRRYHRHKRYLLATHSRQLVRQVAELYLERARSPRAGHLVACALVSLAGYLQETNAMPAAEQAYHDALAYDSRHPSALLGLASVQESYGQYQSAAELLQRLHRLRPDDTQARLRLGVNLRRLDKPRKAMGHLSAALSEPGPAWVTAVAAQELAGLHAGEKRIDEAVAVLGEAAARFSENQRLKVQQAALLDRAGRRSEALALLDSLDPTAGGDADSPRMIYSQAPRAAINAARDALADEIDRRLAERSAAPVPGGGS